MDFPGFVQKYKNAKIAIGIHRNADLDALTSAYALSTIFPNSVILTPDEMNRPSRDFAKEFGISVLEFRKAKKEQFDGLLIVDSASYAMIGEAKGWKTLCLIDHHQKAPGEDRINAELEIVDRASPSTAQIVSSILPQMNEKAAFALAIGIVSDTARFKGGNPQAFEQLAKLLKISGRSYAEILGYAEPELQADEKVEILSAFRKAEVVTYKNFVIATTIVSSSEGDASSSLSEFADVAFAASWRNREKETRVSARARKHIPIKLNEVMGKIGAQFLATGGGHAKAAGANAKEKPEKVLAACVEAVKDALDAV